tara:strand:+ start:170 stop:394 length:225 start_codon:yes stop_codon:yes gene_type:complete
MKKHEATLISYKLVIDQKGKVYSERSLSDIDQIEERFNPILFTTLKQILRNTSTELDKIHNRLEAELNARIMSD